MPRVRDLIKWLDETYEPDDVVAYSLWTTADVEDVAERRNAKLSADELESVLEKANTHQDCTEGLNWGVIDYWVDLLLSERRSEDEKSL